ASIGDGGGGVFYWEASSTAAEDGGTLFAPNPAAPGRWRRVYSGPLDVRWFGADSGGTLPSRLAIQCAIDAAARLPTAPRGCGPVVSLAPGTYLIDLPTPSAQYALRIKEAVTLAGAEGGAKLVM